jgi:hypothetical protein
MHDSNSLRHRGARRSTGLRSSRGSSPLEAALAGTLRAFQPAMRDVNFAPMHGWHCACPRCQPDVNRRA